MSIITISCDLARKISTYRDSGGSLDLLASRDRAISRADVRIEVVLLWNLRFPVTHAYSRLSVARKRLSHVTVTMRECLYNFICLF